MKRKFLQSLVAVFLSLVMTITGFVTASAAPARKQGNVKYLSEVALIEATDKTEANSLLEELKKEENGAFEGMIELNLNAGGAKQVYMVYKTSTNVDDAITDLAVMNMNGDFVMGNYEQLFNKTLESYTSIATDYRTMAEEFKKNYEAGEFGARAAYRQMNYYYTTVNGEKVFMGDYLLNFPKDATDFAKILFSGNLHIITNLRSLMSMGVGDPDATLADRIEASYIAAEKDSSIYSDKTYEKTAKELQAQLEDLKKDLENLPLELKKLEENQELTAEEKEDIKVTLQEALNSATAFYELLKEIPMKDTNLGDFVLDAAIVEAKDLFPIVAAATPAENLMMQYHSFYTLLLYDVLELGETALEEALAEFEKDYEPISVYHGVQNDLIDGTVGVTGDAELLSSTTGQSFVSGQNAEAAMPDPKLLGFLALGGAGFASTVGGALYLITKDFSITMNYASAKANVVTAVAKLDKLQSTATRMLSEYKNMVNNSIWPAGDPRAVNNATLVWEDSFKEITDYIGDVTQEVNQAKETLANTQTSLSGAQIFGGVFTMALGVVMMGVSIWQLTKIYNNYAINYTEIPDNMVHVVNNPEFGDRFVNYNNVPSYYLKDGKMEKRENDMNAYGGKQWVSLYSTKNYEAGYCLTATPDLIAKESARNGYTGIHLFGHNSNYNLNSYSNREGAESTYLAFKYSTNKKSAETDVPDIVGMVVSYGGYAFTGIAGLGLGMGLMTLIKKKKTTVAAK